MAESKKLEQCYFCGADFTGPMPRWQAAIKIVGTDNQKPVGFRWVPVCSDDYWEVPPHGKRPGVRKRVPNEYITKWSNYASY